MVKELASFVRRLVVFLMSALLKHGIRRATVLNIISDSLIPYTYLISYTYLTLFFSISVMLLSPFHPSRHFRQKLMNNEFVYR